MELKTRIDAQEGKQELTITREFDLPVELLFRAYVDAEIVEQWMGTKVLKLESKKHGSYRFETTDPQGNKHGFNGTIHDFVPNEKITRTFEMEAWPAEIRRDAVQLEFLEFERISGNTSKLTMHIIYRSVAYRDQILRLPFVQGVNMAHNQLESTVKKLITDHAKDK